MILALIDDVRLVDGPDGTAGLLVVTDDRDLRHEARFRGARTAGSAWLLGRLGSGRLSSPSIGNPRPPRSGAVRDQRLAVGRRSRRNRPGRLAAGSRRDDQARQPEAVSEDRRDW